MRRMIRLLAVMLLACLAGEAAAAFDSTLQMLPASYGGEDIKQWYAKIAGPDGVKAEALGGLFAFTVDLSVGPNFSREYDAQSGKLKLHYNMAFNQIAEGWSWDEQADPNQRDYYRYKFLPLGSASEAKRAPETLELYPGKVVEVTNLWRYEYFFAFDNLYDFYERKVDDDAGFDASIAVTADEAKQLEQEGRVRLLALCRLTPPWHTESNTFWKATYAHPVDYTLRKRYLVGDLVEVWFYDGVSGRVLGKVGRR